MPVAVVQCIITFEYFFLLLSEHRQMCATTILRI
jgi:hypothetical protein